MQNASFDSINLEDYTLDIREVLEDYAIYKDTWKENYSIHEGTMKNSTQKVKIYRRPFPTDSTSKERFRVLMTAFSQGIVLADNIFLSHEDGGHFLYVVEPLFSDLNDKFIPLSQVLENDISFAKKHRLFQNLVIIVKSLHELGEAHMELCPENIWVEDEFHVYLRPFKLKTQENKQSDPNRANSNRPKTKSWYSSPEYILRTSKMFEDDSLNESGGSLDSEEQADMNSYANDMWSLGCIFSDMFASLSPLFQAHEPFEKLVKFFEVLGIPKKEDVFYMSKELYDAIIRHLYTNSTQKNSSPLINELLRNIQPESGILLRALLSFNPDKRPRCEELMQFSFLRASMLTEYEEEAAPETKLKSGQPSTSNLLERDQRDLSNVKPKAPSEKNDTSSWWNLDLFGEGGGQERPSASRLDNMSPMIPQAHEFTSPTFLQQQEQQPAFSGLDQRRFGEYSNRKENNQDSLAYTLAGDKRQLTSGKKGGNMTLNSSSHKENFDNLEGKQQQFTEKKKAAQTPNFSGTKQSSARELSRRDYNLPQNQERPNLPPLDPRLSLNVKRKLEDDMDNMKDQRSSYRLSRSQQQFQQASRIIDSKLSINIDQLKNVIYNEGSYCCKVEVRTGVPDEDAASIMSNYVAVEESYVRLNLKSEIETQLDLIESVSKEDTLKILIFYTSGQVQMFAQPEEMTLYGICEVDFSKLFSNMKGSARSNVPKTLTGWYNVYDPDDGYMTVAQVKVDLAFQSFGVAASSPGLNISSRQFEQSRNFEERPSTTKPPRSTAYMSAGKMGRSVRERSDTQDYSSLSVENRGQGTAKTPSRSFVTNQSMDQNNKSSSKNNMSVFDIIQNDLSDLNNQLKAKEKEYQRDNEILKKRAHNAYDFTLVVEKLRQIIEDDEEFCY